jgi:hypothetical protein
LSNQTDILSLITQRFDPLAVSWVKRASPQGDSAEVQVEGTTDRAGREARESVNRKGKI